MKKTIVLALSGAALLGAALAHADVVERRFSETNLLVKVTDDAWQPENFNSGITIPAVYVHEAEVEVDGRDDEPNWAAASEVSVPLRFGTVSEAQIKALYTDDEVFIRVRWPDATMDREHHPWVWDSETNSYVAGPQVEDSVLLSFEAGCEWSPSILAGHQFDMDGWHWLAARSDPVGQAWDLIANLSEADRGGTRGGQIYDSRYDDSTWILKFDDVRDKDGLTHQDWTELDRRYLHWPLLPAVSFLAELDGLNVEDASERLNPPDGPPEGNETVFPQFSPVRLDGPAGEVAAKGHWEDGYWTVEFRRSRLTPARFMHDTVFNRLTQFSVHVFDRTEAVDESSESPRLLLKFLPEGQRVAGN
jgi:hypothetical protein